MSNPENTNNSRDANNYADLAEALTFQGTTSEQPDTKALYEHEVSQLEAGASEFARESADLQAVQYKDVVLTLMERSGDNPDLMDALSRFTRELDGKAHFDYDDQSLKPAHQQALVEFLNDAADRISGKDPDTGVQHTGFTIIQK